jgi:hypothetical protein
VREWQLLCREVDGRREATGQEWAEVCLVPSWAATKKDGPPYRFLAIRERLVAKPSYRGWSRPSDRFRPCCLKRAAIRCLGW